MNRQSLILLGVLLALAPLQPAQAQGRAIHLRNGQVVETEFCRQEGDYVFYEKFGGTIRLQMNRVARLDCDSPRAVQAKEPGKGSPLSAGSEALEDGGGEQDLLALLEQALNPQTAIELANLSTIAIESSLGSGSGFFISRDGYILTNKHVVKFSAELHQELAGKLADTRKNLKAAKAALELERSRLSNAKLSLKRDLADLQRAKASGDKRQMAAVRRSIQLQKNHVQAWQEAYEVRVKKYRKGQKEFKKEETGFQRKRTGMRGNRFFKIYLANGKSLSAKLVQVSRQHDLALLKLSGYQTPALEVEWDSKIPLGTPVYAIGNPVGRRNSVSSGVFSARRDQFIQTNAEINPGNSGGPLITEQGRVIGVNTKKLVGAKVEGMGFALAIDLALNEFHDFLGGLRK